MDNTIATALFVLNDGRVLTDADEIPDNVLTVLYFSKDKFLGSARCGNLNEYIPASKDCDTGERVDCRNYAVVNGEGWAEAAFNTAELAYDRYWSENGLNDGRVLTDADEIPDNVLTVLYFSKGNFLGAARGGNLNEYVPACAD